MENTTSESYWRELGLITAIYVILQVCYAAWIGLEPDLELLRDIPDWLKGRDKISILSKLIYVMIITLPLMVGSFLATVVMLHCFKNMNTSGPQVVVFVPLSIIIPFVIYYLAINQNMLPKLLEERNATDDWRAQLLEVAYGTMKFYLTKYKLPLFVASILYGSWAGHKMRSSAEEIIGLATITMIPALLILLYIHRDFLDSLAAPKPLPGFTAPGHRLDPKCLTNRVC